jgi:hypothetical protein
MKFEIAQAAVVDVPVDFGPPQSFEEVCIESYPLNNDSLLDEAEPCPPSTEFVELCEGVPHQLDEYPDDNIPDVGFLELPFVESKSLADPVEPSAGASAEDPVSDFYFNDLLCSVVSLSSWRHGRMFFFGIQIVRAL